MVPIELETEEVGRGLVREKPAVPGGAFAKRIAANGESASEGLSRKGRKIES